MSGAICGSCTMCCKAFYIAELDKPVGEWCPHCLIGGGCKRYDTRPPSCRTYECAYYTWITDGLPVPDRLRPDRCGVIIDAMKDSKDHHIRVLHPHRPEAWREPLVQRTINMLIDQGASVYLVKGETRSRIRKQS
jgi:uncharacterized protein